MDAEARAGAVCRTGTRAGALSFGSHLRRLCSSVPWLAPLQAWLASWDAQPLSSISNRTRTCPHALSVLQSSVTTSAAGVEALVQKVNSAISGELGGMTKL